MWVFCHGFIQNTLGVWAFLKVKVVYILIRRGRCTSCKAGKEERSIHSWWKRTQVHLKQLTTLYCLKHVCICPLHPSCSLVHLPSPTLSPTHPSPSLPPSLTVPAYSSTSQVKTFVNISALSKSLQLRF